MRYQTANDFNPRDLLRQSPLANVMLIGSWMAMGFGTRPDTPEILAILGNHTRAPEEHYNHRWLGFTCDKCGLSKRSHEMLNHPPCEIRG